MKIYDVRGIGANLTGSFSGSFKGLFTGPLDGVAATSSYVEYTDVANKPALVSGSSQVLAFNVFATTGSNQFNGNQAITGSLTVTGQVIAQTLNVQQVTSSIVFSSGSNRFGNNSGNTHSFTGSVNITGSLSATSVRISAAGSANPTFFRNTSGTTSSTTSSNVVGFNGTNNIFVSTQNRGGFILGFNNSVQNREYTLPDASGTVALTTNLGAYLPLTGGTLTGALNGTSATFSGGNYINGTFQRNIGNGSLIEFKNYAITTQYNWFVGCSYNNSNVFEVIPSTDAGNDSPSGTSVLSIASTGAATFSSSVTASGIISNDFSASGTFAASFTNSNSTGYGLYVRGGSNVREAILIADNAGNQNIRLYGDGSATFSSSVTASGIISSEDVRIYRSASNTTGYINFGSTGTNYFGWGGSDFVFNGNINAGAATFTGDLIITSLNPLAYCNATSNNRASGIVTQESGTSKWAFGTNFGEGDNSWNVYNYAAGSRYLTITSTGTATFTGAVTATSFNGAFSISMQGAGNNNLSDGPFYRFVNTTNSYQLLKQLNTSTGEDVWYFNGSAWSKVGNLNAVSGVYTALSDVNKKKDFEDSTIGLNAILGLKPTLYRMEDEDESVEKQLGFIAQEVKEYIPQACVEQENFVGLQDRPIIAALVNAIKELKSELDTAKAEIQILKQQ
jgi:fibronectin-binding autotransporter adhesin